MLSIWMVATKVARSSPLGKGLMSETLSIMSASRSVKMKIQPSLRIGGSGTMGVVCEDGGLYPLAALVFSQRGIGSYLRM